MVVIDTEVSIDKKYLPMTIEVPSNWESISPKICVFLTHGAGGDKDFHQLVALSIKLAESGYMCARFTCKGLNIKYRTRAYVEVVRHVCLKYSSLTGCVFAGRSMGSCAAHMAANCISKSPNQPKSEISDKHSEQTLQPAKRKRKHSERNSKCDVKPKPDLCENCHAVHPPSCNTLGVICLSYPLHPVGGKELRSQPILEANVPVIFLSGTNDDMCDLPTLETILTTAFSNQVSCKLTQWKNKSDLNSTCLFKINTPTGLGCIASLDNAIHSLKVKGLDDDVVIASVCEVVLSWLQRILP
ncbi:unnamed protein product [Clavelina lepadiformis]|uniref:KANL3/Tex30 alpha/beta hydrolase-like domain-containing protein n=1 Tax=Clavelina lepadiformis TaxID=159417 RepID=A0ABP0F4M2_CLALP